MIYTGIIIIIEKIFKTVKRKKMGIICIEQWILGKDNMTSYFGCVGKDEFSATLQQKASEAGVCVKYQVNEENPTG